MTKYGASNQQTKDIEVNHGANREEKSEEEPVGVSMDQLGDIMGKAELESNDRKQYIAHDLGQDTYFALDNRDGKPKEPEEFQTYQGAYDYLGQQKAKQQSKEEKEHDNRALAQYAHRLMKIGTSSPDHLEKLVTNTAELIQYGNGYQEAGGNRVLMMANRHHGVNFATKEKFQNNPKLKQLDFNDLEGVKVFVPKKSNGKLVTFEAGRMYSAEEIGQKFPDLANEALKVARKNDGFRSQEKSTRVYQAVNVLAKNKIKKPSWCKDPLQAAQNHMTRYIVYANAGVANKPFKFSERELAAVSTLSSDKLHQMYAKMTSDSKNLTYQLGRNYERKQEAKKDKKYGKQYAQNNSIGQQHMLPKQTKSYQR